MASISMRKVSVQFPLLSGAQRSLKNSVLAATTGGRIARDAREQPVISALNDIDLELRVGDRVAVCGHNGSGKSTLLRVLAGIYEPAGGVLDIRGSVGAIFDPALGMDPEASGMENIVLRLRLMGFSRRQIDERIDEIAGFTGLGPFLHMPVRTYSAGMGARLAFAISTSVMPDILILDEGIGAGDASFFEQANARLRRLVDAAGILLLASHSFELLRQFCTRAILLEHGALIASGPLEEVLSFYHERTHGPSAVRRAA
jgi:ABC-2 type transport system ATP-binding protein/lipopolysaccharide transport system ATP-binding protein